MPFIIQVDGIIGAGKSWYIDNILIPSLTESGYNPILIKEPVNEWREILPLFYGNMKRWAYTFQTIAMMDRVEEVRRTLQGHSDSDNVIFISERGVTSDRMFMNILHVDGCVTDMEMRLYGKWWNMWYTLIMCVPYLVIYLNTDIELCQSRIIKRGRVGELTDDGKSKIALEYQSKLKEQHDIRYHGKSTVKLIPWVDTKVVEIVDTTKDETAWKSDTVKLMKEVLERR